MRISWGSETASLLPLAAKPTVEEIMLPSALAVAFVAGEGRAGGFSSAEAAAICVSSDRFSPTKRYFSISATRGRPRGDESALVCSCSGPRRNRVRGTSWWLPPPWPATGRGQRWFLRSFPLRPSTARRCATTKKRTDLSLTRKPSSPPLVLVLHLVSPTQSQEHSQQRSFLLL